MIVYIILAGKHLGKLSVGGQRGNEDITRRWMLGKKDVSMEIRWNWLRILSSGLI
jgi:hypothetical protein